MAEKRKRSARWHLHLHPSIQILGSGPQHAFSRSPRAIHPTHVQLSRVSPDDEPGKPLEATWTSRDHRKNRHWVVPPGGQQQRIRSSRGRSIWSKLGNLRHLEYWNISWWVAMVCVFLFLSSVPQLTEQAGFHTRKRSLGGQRLCSLPSPLQSSRSDT